MKKTSSKNSILFDSQNPSWELLPSKVYKLLSYAQVTHSRIWRRISHGYDPASSVAIRISPYISILHP